MGDFAADGTVVHSTDLNKIFKLYGAASQLAGTAPSTGASSGLLFQAGQAIVTTNGAGDGNYTFPTAFPNGLLFVTLVPSAPTAHLILYNDPTGTAPPSKTGFSFRYYSSPGGAIVAGSCRFSFFAIGN